MSDIKFSCSACRQHIICDSEFSGVETTCPNCQSSITIPFANRMEAIPLPGVSFGPVPATLSVYGALIIGFNCLSLLFSGVNLLQLLVAAPVVAMIIGTPSIALGILGIRLGAGLRKGERVAVLGAFVVTALQLAVWCLAMGVALQHPPSVGWRLGAACAAGMRLLPLAISAKRNWLRLH